MTTKIDTADPMVAFIIAHPGQTVILHNTDEGRADPLERDVFDSWIAYLEFTGRRDKARVWKWMRNGGSKHLTLPCADPCDFDPKYIQPSARARRYEAAE